MDPIAIVDTTVIVPTFNEAANIEACLAALAAQDIGANRLQVVVVDGRSTDATVEIAHRFMFPAAGPVFAVAAVIVNDASSRPANLNRGLADAVGPVVCRVDARSRIPDNYISACHALLSQRPEVRVVGGRQLAIGHGTAVRLGIARALNNRWGMGGARYRRCSAAGPADTVYLGAFRTDELRSSGGWDERLLVNEDFDLNRRMGQGGSVWFVPRLVVEYVPRPTLRALAAQYWTFGRWKARYLRQSGEPPRPRQTLVAVGAPAVVVVAAASMLNRRTRPYALGFGALATAAVECLGTDGPAGSFASHVVSAAASAVIAGAWVAGLWIELLHPTRPEQQP